MAKTIDRFEGDYRFLSNFTWAKVSLDGVVYPSVENAYQAAKTLDPPLRKELGTCSAANSKRIGKDLPLRTDWSDVKLSIMEDLLIQKFTLPEFRVKLLATGHAELIEGNYWHDQFWGDCYCKKHYHIPGQNHLGRLLMEIRGSLSHED